jgi:peptidoglycan/xylan/chitin deacetylase (PgdA/CDA1 family)
MNNRVWIAGIALCVLMVGGCTTTQKKGESSQPKLIALSFDDGPSEKTESLLAVLSENNAKATFFLIGENIANKPDEAQLIFAGGHEIGNHSYGYEGLGDATQASEDSIRESLTATSAQINGVTGTDPVYFRAPNLDYSETLTAVAGELGMALIGTDVIGFDWEDAITTEGIIDNVLKAAKDGGIILLHERHEGDLERTIRAVPKIISTLRSQGYEIITVGELAKRKGVTLEPGIRYDTIPRNQ